MIYYLKLPFPPTHNAYYVQTRRGKFVSTAGKAFRESVFEECYQQGLVGLQLKKPLRVDIIFYRPDNRIRDFDNHLKSLQDALSSAEVWEDDSVINPLKCVWGKINKPGFVLVRLGVGDGEIPVFETVEKSWERFDLDDRVNTYFKKES